MDIPKTLFATLVKQGRMEMHLTQKTRNIGGLSWRPRTP